MLIAAFIALAWLTAPPPCKPRDLGLFIGDMRMAGARDDRASDHGESQPCPRSWKMSANWRRAVARLAATGVAIP
jgi:hypothetical protein